MSQFANLYFKKTPYDLEGLSQIIDASYSDAFKIDEEIQKLIEKHEKKISHFAKLSGTTEERIEKLKQVIGL